MSTSFHHQRRIGCEPLARRGTTIFEVFVALTLLTTALAVAAPLLVRHNRLLVSARHYRLACDELANQIEVLSTLPADEIADAVADLEVSPFTAERLHDATLTATLGDADVGQRLTLGITWDEPGRRLAPLTLVTWIQDDSEAGDDEVDGDVNDSGSPEREDAP